MGKIKASYVTDKGKQILFGGGTVTYTKAVLYSQDVSHMAVADLRRLTALTGELMTTKVGVSDKTSGQASSVNVEATFTNSGLDHDITFGSVGWFAEQEDGTESLMAVQVANLGANLAAGSPDGSSTDAVDLILSFAISDATTVNAVIDPAGSVTPAKLNGAVSELKTELHTALDTKADKIDLEPLAKSADVANELAKKADKTDLDPLAKTADVAKDIDAVNKLISDVSSAVTANKDDADKKLAEKANSADVYDKKSVDDKLDGKADKTAVSDSISQLQKNVDAKANLTDVYTKTEIDGKVKTIDGAIADASDSAKKAQATADIKVTSDQVAKMIAGKADTADVDKALNGKANINDLSSYATNDSVTKGLALKADQSSVAELFKNYTTTTDLTKMLAVKVDKTVLDDAIAKLQASIDTKASKADLDSKIDAVNKVIAAKANSADTYSKAELDKKLLSMTADTNGKVNADQVAKMIADKANSSDVYSKKDVDDKLAVKADKTAVDQNIAKIQADVNTKADKAEVDAKISAIDFSKIKFRKQYDKGNFTTADKTWTATKQADGTYIIDLYHDDWTAADLVTLANEVRTQHYTKAQVDSNINGLKPSITDASSQAKHAQETADSAVKTVQGVKPTNGNVDLPKFTVTTGYDVVNNSQVNGTYGYGERYLVDPSALIPFANAINSIRYAPQERKSLTKDDDANKITDDGIYRIFGDPIKNGAGKSWCFLIVKKWDDNTIFQAIYVGTNGIYIRNISVTGNSYPDWTQIPTDLGNLQNQINGKTSGTIITDYDIASKSPTKETNSYNARWLVDQGVLPKFADQINQLKGRRTVNAPDCNSLTDTGVYCVTDPIQGKNFPTGSWGTLAVFSGNNARTTQLYVGDDGLSTYIRILNGSNWCGWNQLAWKSDINSTNSTISALQQTIKSLESTVASLQSTITQQDTKITGLQTLTSNQAQELAYIKANYIEGKTFAKADEAKATAWEKQNPQRIAFIKDK